MGKKILVIGSMNVDLVIKTARYPEKGETVLGREFKIIPGGKGANQAVAAGKLGGNVRFIGACGRDNFGKLLLASLKKGGVKTDRVARVNENTGVAAITIEEDGDNRIIVVPGANNSVTPEMIKDVEQEIRKAFIILVQMEIPFSTVKKVIEVADYYNTKVILDPAPASQLSGGLYGKIDYLIPNEGELAQLIPGAGFSREEDKAGQILSHGTARVIVTRGSEGVTLYTPDGSRHYKAVEVETVDTTAAGDAFAGALAFGLSRGWEEERSVKLATRVAGLAVTEMGAQSSLPSMDKVKGYFGSI